MSSDYFTREAERQLETLLAANRAAAACAAPAMLTALDARPYSVSERSALGELAGYDDDECSGSEYTWVTCEDSSDDDDDRSDTESSSDDSSSSDEDSSSSSEDCASKEDSWSKDDDDKQAENNEHNMDIGQVPVERVKGFIAPDDSNESASQEARPQDADNANSLTFRSSDRSLNVEETVPAEKNSGLLILHCLQSSDRELTTRQSRTHSLLFAQKIHYDAIDGSDPANADMRNELFKLSGSNGRYPLFFRRKDDGTFDYIGDYDTVEWTNELGNLKCLMSSPQEPDAGETVTVNKTTLEVSDSPADTLAEATAIKSEAAERSAFEKADAKTRVRREADETMAKRLNDDRNTAKSRAQANHEENKQQERGQQEQENVLQSLAAELALGEEMMTGRHDTTTEETTLKERLEAEESLNTEAEEKTSPRKQESDVSAQIEVQARAEIERLQAEHPAKEADDRTPEAREEACPEQPEDDSGQPQELQSRIKDRYRQTDSELNMRTTSELRKANESRGNKKLEGQSLWPSKTSDMAPKQKVVEEGGHAASTESIIKNTPIKQERNGKDRARGDQNVRKTKKHTSFMVPHSESKARGARHTSGKMFLRLPKAEPPEATAAVASPPPATPLGPPPTEEERRREALLRLQRCYEWYGKLGQPTRVKMRERIARIHSSIGVTPNDVDSMPWTATGRLNVIEMNRIFLQQV